MKNIKEIQDFIDGIPSVGKASGKEKQPWRRIRSFGKISPIGLGVIAVGIAGAMLVGMLFDVYYVNVNQDIEINGSPYPVFYYDGLLMSEQYLNVTGDIVGPLDPGDDILQHHEILNADNGGWDVLFDLSGMQYFYTNTSHEFYGINVSVVNLEIDGTPCSPEDFYIFPGQTAGFDYEIYVNPEFIEPEHLFPFNLSITIQRHPNTAPVAVNDITTLFLQKGHTGTVAIADILANDYDPDNYPGVITLESVGPIDHISCSIVGSTIQLTAETGSYSPGYYQIPYSITDGDMTATATFRISVID